MKSQMDIARDILGCSHEEFQTRAFKWYYGANNAPRKVPDRRHEVAYAQAVIRTDQHNRHTGVTLEGLAA